MLDRIDDTIVAVSSAPGYGAVTLVRLSGPLATTITDRMSKTSDEIPLDRRPGSIRIAGEVAINGRLYLPAFFYVFRAPHSYTRQDIVEILTVGSPSAAELVRKRAIQLGAIPALPGEFTARAFFNGAIDLSQAEAVGGVIRAHTDTQLRAARRIMDGALAKELTKSRDKLAELVALVEAEIDFAEEPIEFLTPPELCARLGEVSSDLNRLRNSAPSAERIDTLPHILLLGPPNAGKSSLMNRLSGISRAICAAVAGTTRDILSAPISLGRGEAILLDSAGIDRSADEIVAAARAMALSTAAQVDLVCLVVDATDPRAIDAMDGVPESGGGRSVVALNKCDLILGADLPALLRDWERREIGPVCQTSALSGTGIEHLRETMRLALGQGGLTTSAEALYLTERQRSAIAEATAATDRAVTLSRQCDQVIDCADLLAFELREALEALGSVGGSVTTEDLLAQIFANFCIGK